MAEASTGTEAPPAKKGKKKLLLILLPVLLLAGGGAAAFFLVPSIHDKFAGGPAAPAKPVEEKPYFVEIPELTVTLPNAGRPRQMRIKIVLELAKHPDPAKDGGKEGKDDAKDAGGVLSPRVYDGLVLYLRTLRDAEVDGALSIDRMRGDLQRRLDLLLGDGVVRDVLITSLVIG